LLNHLNEKPEKPKRVVIMGANGFVGAALSRKLQSQKVCCLALSRTDINLLEPQSTQILADLLKPEDVFVAVSAIAPVKDSDMLRDNITMINNMCEAIKNVNLAQIVNIGSDAIYADSSEPLTENSCASPGSLHGVMHLIRDVMFRETAKDIPYATLRPTLIYGIDDPHNGYGPNRFRGLVTANEEIKLFGDGEELRDHVWIEDVAELLLRMILQKSEGILNAVTGNVISFKDIAKMVVLKFESKSSINSTPRSGPMPHNGFRPFDSSSTKKAFPDFEYTSIDSGIDNIHKALMEKNND